MSRGSPPQGRLRDHDHSRAGEGGSTIDVGEVTADDVNLEDGDTLDFGTDDDVSLKFDPAVGANGAFVLRDERAGAAEDRLVIPLGAALQLAGQNLDLNSQDLEDGGVTIYNAANSEVPNAVVEALANFSANDVLSAYPLESADVDESTMGVTDFDVGAVADGQAVGNSGGSLAGISAGAADPFGDESDGAVTVNTNENWSNLTGGGQILQCTDFTLEAGNTLTIDVENAVLLATGTVTLNGTVDGAGADGANDSIRPNENGTAGLLGDTGTGGAGGTGSGNGASGGAGAGGGGGGNANDGTTGADGGDAAAGAWDGLSSDQIYALLQNMAWTNSWGDISGQKIGSKAGSGGEAGEPGGPPNPEAGGEGGEGGKMFVVMAKNGAGNGTVNCPGGDGGLGGSANPVGDFGDGGSGGGGHGGIVWLFSLLGSLTSVTTDVTGGSGGAAVNSGSGGGNGGAGGDGSAGHAFAT